MEKSHRTPPLDDDALLARIKYLVDTAFFSLIPLVMLSLAIAWASNSLAILSLAVDYGLSFVVQLFAFKSIRAIVASNAIKFPYGTGKLENFSGFLYGALTIPTSVYIFYVTAGRLAAPEQDVALGIAQLAMLPSVARSVYLYVVALRLHRLSDSPMVESYRVNFKTATLFDCGILLALLVATLLTRLGYGALAGFVDPVVSLLLASYMLYTGVTLTGSNFKILMDLPLPEDEQLKIMSVLAREFENYESVGTIYTRRSGKRRFLDIEIYLDERATVADAAQLQARMRSHLEAHFDDIAFNLIALPQPRSA